MRRAGHRPTKEERAEKAAQVLIEELVEYYSEQFENVERFYRAVLGYIESSKVLKALIHSTRSRFKDPDHLRKKLTRKRLEYIKDGKEFDITVDNLFHKINDLAGIRILHLHTQQFFEIDAELRRIFGQESVEIIEGPCARTFDVEYTKLFRSRNIDTVDSDSLYTSVHYVIQSNSEARPTCEIQVRTLMEEAWGETDHTMNYPEKSKHLACREQLRALAKITSGATRLIDSIFATDADLRTLPEVDHKPAESVPTAKASSRRATKSARRGPKR